ncbi:hypothetical protein KVR01_011743 [Diaporthe batatas]|uniref:uncharacterized protein n=1 Tax=Diaporthe batatas TaxID=748121 RepID=UPI001D048F33|nr:uncharacterized protein KVR01_011743 [Diaporthe batatas]KAG8158621.1 hypothetical protein KVR01_011743 [Diaporthe batatas]
MLLSELAAKTFAFFQVLSLSSRAKLLSGGTIIAFDQATEQLNAIRNGSLLIEDGQISAVFDIAPTDVPHDRHGWQTVFKTMGSNTTVADYALRFSAVVAAPLFSPEDVYISQLACIYEALFSGVTTILDHARHTWTPDHSAAGLNASVDSGARILFAYASAFQNSSAQFVIPEQIAQWKRLSSAMSNSSLIELVIAYDYFTDNSTEADT